MNPATDNLEPLMNAARDIALRAGRRIMEIYSGGFEVRAKADYTPVTTADMASDRLIREHLRGLSPSFPIVSEESEKIAFSVRSAWPTCWLVDPLDGTKEFIKRTAEFTVNIALVHEHRPVVGVVHAPARHLTYYGCRGGGAFRDNSKTLAQRIRVRDHTPARPTIVGSRSHGIRALRRFLQRLGDHELIRMGSALKSCLVAEGSADLYPRFGPTSEWDIAAGQCIVEQAGGFVTDTNMQPLRYNATESLENPSFLVFGDPTPGWASYIPADIEASV